jgi:hypothetical protein
MPVLLRLAWALPLVLLVGFGALLILKRFLELPQRSTAKRRMTLHESLALSRDTRLFLIEVDGCAYLVTESAKQPAALRRMHT